MHAYFEKPHKNTEEMSQKSKQGIQSINSSSELNIRLLGKLMGRKLIFTFEGPGISITTIN